MVAPVKVVLPNWAVSSFDRGPVADCPHGPRWMGALPQDRGSEACGLELIVRVGHVEAVSYDVDELQTRTALMPERQHQHAAWILGAPARLRKRQAADVLAYRGFEAAFYRSRALRCNAALVFEVLVEKAFVKTRERDGVIVSVGPAQMDAALPKHLRERPCAGPADASDQHRVVPVFEWRGSRTTGTDSGERVSVQAHAAAEPYPSCDASACALRHPLAWTVIMGLTPEAVGNVEASHTTRLRVP